MAGEGVKAADPAADGVEALGMVDGHRNRAVLPQGDGKGAGAGFLLLGIKHGPRQRARRALLVEKGFPVFRQQDSVPGVKKVVPVIAQKGQRVPLLRRLEVMDVPTNKKKTFFGHHGGRLLAILIGALLVAVGLELFLIPNRVIDGGIVGVSIILDALTPIPLGVYLVLLNLPFLVVGYKQIGKTFALSTLFAVSALAVFVTLLRRLEPVTTDVILATVFGGIILGIGVGLIIRFGGSLDGTEIVAILVNRKFGFSVGEIIMFFNVFILGSAGFVFTWESAMYSLIAYFIAFKTIDVVIEGLDESKSVIIISDESQKISETILARLGRGVTHIYGKGGYTQEEKELLYCIVTRLELSKLKSIVQEIDPNALIAVENVHDVMGGQFKKRPIH